MINMKKYAGGKTPYKLFSEAVDRKNRNHDDTIALKEKEHNTHKSELAKKTNMINQNMRKMFSTKSVDLNKKKEKNEKMKYDSSEYTLKTNENKINMLQVELDSLEQTEKGLSNKIKLVMKQKNKKKNIMKRKKIYLDSDSGGDYN